MTPVSSICVVYDATCGLCTTVKEWIHQQGWLVDITFVAAQSAEARKRFGRLPQGELAVVANTGEVWLCDRAWIVCLWALQDYRDWAIRLSSPLLSMMAREGFAAVSRNRTALSGLLGLRSDQQVEQQLRKVMVSKCELEAKSGAE